MLCMYLKILLLRVLNTSTTNSITINTISIKHVLKMLTKHITCRCILRRKKAAILL